MYPMRAFQTETEKMWKSFSKEPKATWGTSTATRTSTTVGSRTKKKYRSYPATILEEHAQRRQEDGDQDLAESRSGASLPHRAKISLSKEMQTTLTLNVENSQIRALQKAWKIPSTAKTQTLISELWTSSKSLPDKQKHARDGDG
jgi:hypothetical protein